MTDATTDTTAPVPTRWCRGSSAPCRCPACSRHEQGAQDGEEQPVSDAYRFDVPSSLYRVWHGIIPPPTDDARAGVVTTTAPNTLAESRHSGALDGGIAAPLDPIAAPLDPSRDPAAQCQHRSRLIRRDIELCDDVCGAVLRDDRLAAGARDAEPSGNPGEFARLGRELGELVEAKQRAYGDSYGRSGEVMRVLYPDGIRPEQYDDALAVVRVVDKLFRVATDRDALGESPWRDIAGYGLLGAARAERQL